MFATITQSIKAFKNSLFFKSKNTTLLNEKDFTKIDSCSELCQESWYGLSLPIGYKNENDKTIYRDNLRKEIVKGRVVKHVSHGLLILIPSGEIGLVQHCELDWSLKRGRKYFPVGSEHEVMILSRPYNNHLYLSIREVNFPRYFNEAISEYPIGKLILRRIIAVKDYGFFVNVKPRIDVFFHKSNVENSSLFNVDDLIEIKITGYDLEHYRLIAELV